MDDLRKRIREKFIEKELEMAAKTAISRKTPSLPVAAKTSRTEVENETEENVETTLTKMSYDELYNEIMLNSEDIDALTTIAEAIRTHPNLTDFEREKLWEIIDKMVRKRG